MSGCQPARKEVAAPRTANISNTGHITWQSFVTLLVKYVNNTFKMALLLVCLFLFSHLGNESQKQAYAGTLLPFLQSYRHEDAHVCQVHGCPCACAQKQN